MVPEHVADHDLSGDRFKLTTFGATHKKLLGICRSSMFFQLVRSLESSITSIALETGSLGSTRPMNVLAMPLQFDLIVANLIATTAAHPHNHDLLKLIPGVDRLNGVLVILLRSCDVLQKLALTLKIELTSFTMIQ